MLLQEHGTDVRLSPRILTPYHVPTKGTAERTAERISPHRCRKARGKKKRNKGNGGQKAEHREKNCLSRLRNLDAIPLPLQSYRTKKNNIRKWDTDIAAGDHLPLRPRHCSTQVFYLLNTEGHWLMWKQ